MTQSSSSLILSVIAIFKPIHWAFFFAEIFYLFIHQKHIFLDILVHVMIFALKSAVSFYIFCKIGLLLLRKPLVLAQYYTAVGYSTVPIILSLRDCPGCRTQC